MCFEVSVQTILVVNSKGGSGKTTVATNLASCFATKGLKTALMDYDPQGSSLHWLKTRPPSHNQIHGANAAKAKAGTLRSWNMQIPQDIQRLVIDAPAGANGITLQEMGRRADRIIIPVAPSSIDVHATADFIKDLMLIGKIQLKKTKVAVIANRVRSNMPLYAPLERFLNSLHIPFITKLTDSHHYVHAAELGLGIYDLDREEVHVELEQFDPIVKWIDTPFDKGHNITAEDVNNNLVKFPKA